MSRNERFLAKLAGLAAEYRERLRPEQLVQSRLRWEDWEGLRVEAVELAEGEIRRRKWRGSRRGVLPEGYDAEAVANQAIEEMMSGKCRLTVGFTREKVAVELKRLVSQRVRVLHRLKEAGAMRSEWDGAVEDGKSLLEGVAWEGERADEAVSRREEEKWREGMVKEFEALLAGEPELRAIFGCLCAGVEESKEIGGRLGVDEAVVVKGRKKLIRRAGELERRVRERKAEIRNP